MSRLKTDIQTLVAEKIPDAFTLRKAELPRKIPTGIQPLDLLIQGFQRGDLTEIYGHGSSGRTTMAVSFMAEVTRQEVCALVDVSDSLDTESLSAAGVDLNRLLWIRCGKTDETLSDSFPIDQASPCLKQSHPIPSSSAMHGSSFSSGRHPRHEVRGLSHAIATLMGSDSPSKRAVIKKEILSPRPSGGRGEGERCEKIEIKFDCGSPLPRWGEGNRGRLIFSQLRGEGVCATVNNLGDKSPQGRVRGTPSSKTIWKRLEQALRVTDLLLNNGGFGAVVLDLGDVPIENARRIPLTSWFRFRRSVENTPTVLLLLSNEPCGSTCASLVLYCQCRQARWLSAAETKANFHVFTLGGLELMAEVARCRGQSQTEVMSGRRSSLVSSAHWQTSMSWAR
jgi:recombination protein RecA